MSFRNWLPLSGALMGAVVSVALGATAPMIVVCTAIGFVLGICFRAGAR